MSMMEVWGLLFNSNADELDKGNKKAEASTKKLEKELAATDRMAEKAHESLRDTLKEVTGMFVAFATFESIREHIMEAAEFSEKMGKLAGAIGVNVEELSAWSDAVKATGGSVEGFQDSIKTLTASFSDFATKGHSRAAPFFKALHIAMVDAHGKARDVLQVLPELADKFQQLSRNESFGMGRKMGFDEHTIMLLQSGRAAVEAMIKRQKELGVVTEEDSEIAEKYNKQYADTAHAFRSIYIAIGTTILPALTSLLKEFEHLAVWTRKHSDFIVGGLMSIATAISYYIIPALVESVLAFSPFLLIGAVIAGIGFAFAALYEDIQAFRHGHKSLIGEMLEKWPIIGKIFHAVGESIQWMINLIKEFFGLISAGIGKLEGVYDKVKSIAGGFGSKIEANITSAQQALNFADTTPLAAVTSTSIANSASSNKSNQVSVGNITINTQATDSDQIAKSFKDSLTQQMRHAINNFDDGVAA